MNRRDLFRGLGAGFLATAIARSHAFAGAPSKFNLGFVSAPDEGFDTADVKLVAGRVPADLRGTYFVNGPARHDRGDQRYDHWFDGDGMVHAFRFDDGAVSHQGRYVQTPKFKAESAAGALLFPAFGTIPENPRPVTGADDMNVANISVLPAGDELLALWEGGSAFALDPATLETIGPKVLSDDLQGVPFSAHPRVSPDGTIWNFGLDAFGGRVVLYQLSPDGDLRNVKLLSDMPKGMMHDFLATENYLIMGFPPFEMTGKEGSYVDRFEWRPERPRRYVVVSKSDFDVVRQYELPAAFQFHHFNAWEDKSGNIHLAACVYKDTHFVEVEARAVMNGTPFSSNDHAAYEKITLYADGRFSMDRDGTYAEFPVFDPREGEARSRTWNVGRETSARDTLGNTLFARDRDGAVTSYWSASAQTLLGEHVVIPTDGETVYLIGTQFDAERGRTLLSLFNGDAVSAGPLAVWALPYVIPVPLHGTWWPA